VATGGRGGGGGPWRKWRHVENGCDDSPTSYILPPNLEKDNNIPLDPDRSTIGFLFATNKACELPHEEQERILQLAARFLIQQCPGVIAVKHKFSDALPTLQYQGNLVISIV
jgi:hypothetical protein